MFKKTTPPSPDGKLERLLEAARRADWDAKHGPKHLRSGRFKPDETPQKPLKAAE